MDQIHMPDHPSADLFGALDEALWEALATAATENALVAPLAGAAAAKLASMGLLQGGSRPTAAGYALLLSWHRKYRRPRGVRGVLALLQGESRHVIHMRSLWGC